MTDTIDLGFLPDAAQESWLALFDVARRVPRGWALVGGQMVYLYAVERGATPQRATEDVDAVLDIRADPVVLEKFTRALMSIGFEPQSDHQGRHSWWLRGDARIDILIPTGLGRAAFKKGASGGTAFETPAAQQALDRAELVTVRVADSEAAVWRPSMAGALVAKAAASGVQLDRGSERHLTDFALVSTLVRPADGIRGQLTRKDRTYLTRALGALAHREDLVASVPRADASLATLRRIVQAE